MFRHPLEIDDSFLALTKHAARRCAQRGVKKMDFAAFFEAADTDRQVGQGCTAWTISEGRVAELRADGMAPSKIDVISKMVCVVGHDGRVLTVAKLYIGHRGRAYRRNRAH